MEIIEKDNNDLNVDYNIFNALNLYNNDLGQSYIDTGFNPFGNNFVLDENFIADVLNNEKAQKDFDCPAFLEQNENEIAKCFDLSETNILSLYNTLDAKSNSANMSPIQKKHLQKILIALKMYLELIKIYKLKLKKEKNKYQLYLNLLAINWNLSNELSSSFTNEFNLNHVVNSIIEQEVSLQQQNDEIIQQAREIIENNKKSLEQTTEQTTYINPYQEALDKLKKESNLSKNTQQKSTSNTSENISKNTEDLER